MRLDDGLPEEKNWFPSPKQRLEIQKSREINVGTDDLRFITFLKYGIRQDHQKRFLATPQQGITLVNQKLNSSITIPPQSCPSLKINLLKDMNKWRLKDRFPEDKKYVIHNHETDFMIKAPFGVITAFPDDPNSLFDNNSCASSSSVSTSTTKDTHTDKFRETPNRNKHLM